MKQGRVQDRVQDRVPDLQADWYSWQNDQRLKRGGQGVSPELNKHRSERHNRRELQVSQAHS